MRFWIYVLLFVLVVSSVVIVGGLYCPPHNSKKEYTNPRTEEAKERLKAHLLHPNSLTIKQITILPGRGENHSIQIIFTATGRQGSGESHFVVRWTGGQPEDMLPETIEGELDDPHGLFTTLPETQTPSSLPPSP